MDSRFLHPGEEPADRSPPRAFAVGRGNRMRPEDGDPWAVPFPCRLLRPVEHFTCRIPSGAIRENLG